MVPMIASYHKGSSKAGLLIIFLLLWLFTLPAAPCSSGFTSQSSKGCCYVSQKWLFNCLNYFLLCCLPESPANAWQKTFCLEGNYH